MNESALIKMAYTPPVRVAAHLLFWSTFALMFYLVYERYDSDASWIFVTKDMFVLLTIFYPTAYLIIPKWLLREKYLYSFCWAVLTYIWWATISYLLCVWIYDHYELTGNLKGYVEMARERGLKALVTWENIPFYLLDFSYLVSLPIGLKLTQSFIFERVKKIELERDNLRLELNFLKAQLSPHFLFNSLDNIYRMVDKRDERAADTILALANLMRYTLYESNDPFVPLDKEVEFINDLLDLERLRYSEKVTIDRHIEINDEKVEIAPLVLVPFIENAFKHGPEKSQKNAWVAVHLNVTNGVLHLKVSNSLPISTSNNPIGGVGLSNAKKRLELNYENNYVLDAQTSGNSHFISLKIYLENKYMVCDN